MKQLPQRPRLRVTFWYEGEHARCELVLMDERRELVHRETLPIEPGSGLERVHSGLLSAAGSLARARDQATSQPEVPSAAADPSEPPELSPPEPPARVPREPPSLEQLEQLAAERHRRAERQASELAEPSERPEPETPPLRREPPSPEQLEQLQAERMRRAALQAGGQTVIDNSKTEPE